MDWEGLMRLGLHQLGLAPKVFWRLTPVELMLKMGAGSGDAPLSRARLAELVQAYPDSFEGDNDG